MYVYIRRDYRVLYELEEWPGVGVGISGVPVEYKYVWFTDCI
jgi:hypothetical protein